MIPSPDWQLPETAPIGKDILVHATYDPGGGQGAQDVLCLVKRHSDGSFYSNGSWVRNVKGWQPLTDLHDLLDEHKVQASCAGTQKPFTERERVLSVIAERDRLRDALEHLRDVHRRTLARIK